jgi:hypothetical protein
MTTQNKPTNMETHEHGINEAAYKLIEGGISTRRGPGRRIDLILTNGGKTIQVTGYSEEPSVILATGSIDKIKADYLVIMTNLVRTYPRIHIMRMEDAKNSAIKDQSRATGEDIWFINPSDYREYRENYSILE